MTQETSAAAFRLDPRLAGDTLALGDFPLSRVLMMDERRYPWVVLVPRRAGLVELHELHHRDMRALAREVAAVGRALASVCDKVNTGALGNIVAQLHIHVVGRSKGDPAWPGPVWGHSPREPHGADADAAADRLRRLLGLK